MAEKLNFKVSYVRVTEDGMERHNNVMLEDISQEERKDIKSLTFLPINSDKVWNISGVLKGFPILEYLYLPSTMIVTMKEAIKECPMLKSLLLLTANNAKNSLSQSVVKVNATEVEGNNTAEFRTFVTTTKDGRQVFEVNSKQIQNKPIIVTVETIRRLTYADILEYISGEKGIAQGIDAINSKIQDSRCKIDISVEILESLLSLFVEKGVTFEEFTIDFSKLYDKIESYKTIMKNVNEVSLKEEVEGSIVEAYQNVQRIHYENLLKELALPISRLCNAVTLDTENLLIEDLKTFVTNVIVESPEFPADDFASEGALNDLLDYVPTGISRHLKASRERGLVRKYLSQVVSFLKTNGENLVSAIEARLASKTSLEHSRDTFAKSFGLDVSKKQSEKLLGAFTDALVDKNFGVLTKNDVVGMIDGIKKELKNGEVQGRALLQLIKNVVDNYLTEKEIKDVVVDFVADSGYEKLKPIMA